MRLVLIRHGKTEANERRLYCGATDIPLSPKGREELQDLKANVDYPDVSGFLKITSGMCRADETMRLLFDAEPDLRQDNLREMNFGSFEMHSYDELRENEDYQAWISDETGDKPTPGGESAKDFRNRVLAGIADIQTDAVVVCHGGVIAALMEFWFPNENMNMYQWQPSGGLGYIVDFKGAELQWYPIGHKSD